ATLNAGTTADVAGQAWVQLGPSILNNGSIVGNGRLDFLSDNTAQSIGGSGGTFPNVLDIDTPNGITISPTSAGITTFRVDLFRGTVTNSNKVTIGQGDTSRTCTSSCTPLLTTQIGGSASTPGGSFDRSPVFRIGAAGYD